MVLCVCDKSRLKHSEFRGDRLKLSTKGKYGLRAFIDLAVWGEEKPVALNSIAERQEISVSYLEQLMAKLKKAGLVKSLRGVNGGYTVAKPVEEISVGDVLRALEGDLTPVECAGIDSNRQCSSSAQCVSKIVWKRINDSINDTVNSIYIGELVKESKRQI
ncbi:Rrf2 family protein [Eubacterium sp. 14-2]|nr:Rrf2 family protein [Eubacterium sp. 14-2]